MSFFLRIKHWQLFLLTSGLYIVAGTFARAIFKMNSDVSTPVVRFFTIIAFGYYLFVGMWIYSIVNIFKSMLPVDMSVNISLFKSCLIFYLLYQFLMITVFSLNGSGHIFITMVLSLRFVALLTHIGWLQASWLLLKDRSDHPLAK